MTGPSRGSFFENLSVLPGRSPAIYVLSVRRIRGLPISTARTCPGLAPVRTCTWDANRKKNPKGGCCKIAEDSVRLLSHELEDLDYSKLYQAYSAKGRNPAVDPNRELPLYTDAGNKKQFISVIRNCSGVFV